MEELALMTMLAAIAVPCMIVLFVADVLGFMLGRG
jgi:hypothetical protein